MIFNKWLDRRSLKGKLVSQISQQKKVEKKMKNVCRVIFLFVTAAFSFGVPFLRMISS